MSNGLQSLIRERLKAEGLLQRRAVSSKTRASPSTRDGSIDCTGSSMTTKRNGLSCKVARGRNSERVSFAWSALTRGCHQHPYELPPTSAELQGLLRIVEDFTGRVSVVTSGAAVRVR